ncbi:MAG: MFS transporter [Anaerolineae bacterium]|nr:MFS transporter [Anaerolineae bacterium]
MKHPLFLSLYLPSFLFFFSSGVLGPITPLYMNSFDINLSYVGLMLSMASLGKMTVEIPGGILIARLGIKRSLLIGMFMISLATIAMFWSSSPLEVLIYQFITGVGSMFYQTAHLSYAASVTEHDNRGRSLSMLGGMNRLSRIIAPALGGVLATSISLKFPFLFSGFIYLIAMIIVLINVPNVYAQPRQTTSNLRILWRVARQNADPLWRVGIGAVLLTTVRMARFTLLPLFASEVLGLDASQIGIILSVASIADMLNVYTAGTLMDRFGRRWAAIPCVAVMAFSMVLMPFTSGFWGLLLVGVIAGAGNGFGSGIMMTMGSDLAPRENREEFLSLWILLLDLGGVACPMIVGGISDILSLTASGFAFFGIGVFGVIAFLFLVPETQRQRATHAAPQTTSEA